MHQSDPPSVTRDQRSAVHRLAVAVCWIGIAGSVSMALLLAFVNPAGAWQAFLVAAIPAGFLTSALGQLQPPPIAAGLPMRCRCRSITLGSGELSLDQDGTIRFASTPSELDNPADADDSTLERSAQLGGRAVGFLGLLLGLILTPLAIILGLATYTPLDPMIVVVLGWGMALIPFWLYWRHHRRVQSVPPLDRSLTISQDELLAVIPYRRLLLGPSIVVGYQVDGEAEPRWVELLLSSLDSVYQLPQPTTDPDQFTQLADPTPATPEQREAANRYRAQLHRREAIAQWLVATGIIAFVMTCSFGGVGLLIGAPLLGILVAGIGALVTSIVVAVVELATFR